MHLKPFFLKPDSRRCSTLGKKDDEFPIEYVSRPLLPVERNNSTTEREALAVVWPVKKISRQH